MKVRFVLSARTTPPPQNVQLWYIKPTEPDAIRMDKALILLKSVRTLNQRVVGYESYVPENFALCRRLRRGSPVPSFFDGLEAVPGVCDSLNAGREMATCVAGESFCVTLTRPSPTRRAGRRSRAWVSRLGRLLGEGEFGREFRGLR